MYIGGSATTRVRPQKYREPRPPPLRTGSAVVVRPLRLAGLIAELSPGFRRQCPDHDTGVVDVFFVSLPIAPTIRMGMWRPHGVQTEFVEEKSYGLPSVKKKTIDDPKFRGRASRETAGFRNGFSRQ